MAAHEPDQVVYTNDTFSTKNYDQFTLMEGNRDVDRAHVKQLQKLMLKNGNLTYEFPIIVDKDFNIIDGQHRFSALKDLGWEVGYQVEERATIDTVRAINQGQRNWAWRDVAVSYSKLGNDNYTWFLQFVDMYGLRKYPALAILAGRQGKKDTNATFNSGELEIKDKARAHDLAKALTDITRLVELNSTDFSHAVINLMRSPEYNHERMMHKLRGLGSRLSDKATTNAYMRELEEIFNSGYADDNKVRMF